MKIRTQFMISALVLGSFLLLVSASEIITDLWIQKINQQEELAAQIERQAYELGYLANDYLLYRESQQASRWESKFASFSNDLSKIDVNTPEQQVLLANIKANQQRQKAVFAEVKASIESAPQPQEAVFDSKFMQVSWSRLEVQNQGMIFDASRLERMLREQENQLRRVTSLLSFVLIGVLGAFLLGNYGLTFRRTLRAITELQAGTRIIGSGDLDFAIAVNNEDEIGELSRAFNQMTTNLKQVTASKADLETEIIERKRAENALRESESKYRNLFENMVEEVHFWQIVRDEAGQIKTWRLVDANPPTLKTWGRSTVEEIQGKTTDEIFGPGATEHYMPVVQNIMTKGLPYAYEDYFPNLDRYFRFTSVPLGDYFITTGADITGIKKAEEVLRQKEADLREAQRIAHIGSWYWDARTDITTGSDELLRIYGFDPETQVMPDFREQRGRCYPVEDWERVNAAVQKAIETGVGYELDVKAIRNGETIWITTRSEVVRDAQGQIVGLRGTVQDITDRKQADEALRQSEERFKLALGHAPVSVATQDRDLVYTWAYNQRTRRTDEIVGKTDMDLFPSEAARLTELKRRVLNTGENLSEQLWVTSNDRRLFLDLFIEPLRDEAGEIDGVGLATVDLTRVRLAEETLRRNETLLQAVLDNTPEAIYLKDCNSRLILANPATFAVIGKPAAAVLGKTDAEFYDDPASGRAIIENDRRIMNSGQMEVIEESVADPAGTRVYLSTKAPYRDADGQIIGLIGVAREITEHKKAEAELIRLASFPERNPNSIIELQYSGDIVYLNPKARELFPDIASSSLKHPILAGLEYLIPKFKAGDLGQHIIQEVKAGDAFYHQTVVNIPESGRIRLYNVDITARKQVEEALLAASLEKQASQYARTLIEVSLDPMVTISPDGKITDVNEATVKATGVLREELVGTDFSGYFTEPEKAEQGYRQVFNQGSATDYPLTIRHCDGHRMDVLYNASLYKDANGSVLGAFAAARDVTAQKQAESELKRHKDNLEMLVKERTAKLEESSRELVRSNENLEQFAYVASHDLQEPLRIMSSYSQLLERRYKGRLDQDADEFIDFIVDAAARMQKLITDLLAYSRAGRETTDLVGVDCNTLVSRLVANMAVSIESAGGCVTFDNLPIITAHESSLTQLFQNLIGNALKFRGEQPPRIHVSARQVEGEWVFSVCDNGIGIEPQYCQRIFMIFQRLHPRSKYPGTGIGLSICKKIVENLRGRIWVESEPGQGSTFCFTVPVRQVVGHV